MTIKFGLLDAPEEFETGPYQYEQERRVNAQGNGYEVGPARVRWVIPELSIDNWRWLTITVMGGELTYSDSFVLWTDSVTQLFSSGILNYPEYEHVTLGRYINVEMVVDQLVI